MILVADIMKICFAIRARKTPCTTQHCIIFTFCGICQLKKRNVKKRFELITYLPWNIFISFSFLYSFFFLPPFAGVNKFYDFDVSSLFRRITNYLFIYFRLQTFHFNVTE